MVEKAHLQLAECFVVEESPVAPSELLEDLVLCDFVRDLLAPLVLEGRPLLVHQLSKLLERLLELRHLEETSCQVEPRLVVEYFIVLLDQLAEEVPRFLVQRLLVVVAPDEERVRKALDVRSRVLVKECAVH